MAERTLLLCKSESLSRGLTFEVAERFERRGLHMIGCRMLTPTAEQAQRWRERGGSQTRSALPLSPLVAMVWGGEDAVAAGLEIVGEAEMSLAAHGTVRADLALTPEALEVSASAKEAENEIGLFFSEQELAEDEGKAAMPAGKGKGAAPTATSPKADLPSAAAPKAASAPEPAAQPKQPAATPAVAEGMSKAQLKKDAKKAEKAAKKAAHKGTPVPSISYDPPSGTRDFFPDQMRVRTWLFNKFKEVARQLAFVEYDAPVLEAEQLYVRKGGEEITGQMYNFVDKDGKRVSLRPEMTPTLARMILSLGGKVLLPVKWFSIPQCWRFETVQRGRKREHFQWNMDIIGEPSIAAEAELLAGITTFFKSIGITSQDVGIKVNSRRVLSSILKMYGISDDKFAEVCVIVDKLDKIGPDETVALLLEKDVQEEPARKIVASLSLKSLGELKALVGEGSADAIAELTELFALAEAYGFGDWLMFDASVVRGLAYYTGIVFEGFDRKGELRAICGGGRYDGLLSLYGSPTMVPACGFGFGDCVIMELLADKGLLPNLEPEVDFVVCPYNAEMRLHAVRVTAALRQAGYAVDVLLANKRADKAFNYADRVCGRRMVFVAPDEWDNGSVRMKDLRLERTAEEKLADRGIELKVDTLVESLSSMGIKPQRDEA